MDIYIIWRKDIGEGILKKGNENGKKRSKNKKERYIDGKVEW